MIMVIMLLLMSAAMLNATRKQMEGALSLLAGERIFYQQSSQATSAMNWGGQQHWSALTGWQCKKNEASGWRACLLQQNHQPALVRADSGENTLAFWQWMERSEAGELKKVPHGWLDFCPLAEEKWCQPDD
ncbi:hypothetical protein ETR_05273 [Erwinia tracheiphila PSU-1]|nr:DUF2509 family protein [Erwinia tracheiphila]EOS95986.1 hypothetical protein ETR_05273 [Erwinia tracheiphila PSU-1]UIA93148.1 YgdB family protein [Erwinia tracheiphila]